MVEAHVGRAVKLKLARCPDCNHTVNVHTDKKPGCAYCKCAKVLQ